MGFGDVLNYVMYDNPVSHSVIGMTKTFVKPLVSGTDAHTVQQIKVIQEPVPLWKLAQQSGPFVRLAGLSGASAVALGAYGAHKKYPKEKIDQLKPIFETANRFHFISSLALLGVPLCKYPQVSGSLIILGTVLFSGTCYYHAFTGENKFGRLAPVGGTVLILGWLAMVL